MARSIFKNILIVGSGGAIAQLINVSSTPLITRLYSPDSYGEWALIIAAASIFGDISVLRYELAVVLPKAHDLAVQVLGLTVVLAFFSSSIALILSVFYGEALLGTSAQWAWCIPILVWVPGIYQALLSWCTRRQEFLLLSCAVIVLPLVTNAVQIATAWFGIKGTVGLISGTILGQIVALFLLGRFFIFEYNTRFARVISLDGLRKAFIQYKNYPLYMTPYTLVGVFKNRTAIFLLNFIGDKVNVGFYAFSDRLIRLPGNFISGAIRPVFFQRASVSNFEDLEPILIRVLRFINKFTTPFFVFFIFEAESLFALAFGEEWRGASLYAVILSCPAFVLIHSNWLDRGLDVLGRQKLAFQLEFVFSLLSIVALVVGLFWLNSVLYGIILQSMVLVCYNVYWLVAFFNVAAFDIRALWHLGGLCIVLLLGCCGVLAAGRAVLPPVWANGLYLTGVGIFCVRVLKNEWHKLKADANRIS